MSSTQYYLRPEVVVEPLISRWYEWSHMVSPATACLNITYRYLPLVESFVTSPSAHVIACNDPKLRGSPFVDLPASRVDEIINLISVLKKEQAEIIQFGSDLRNAFRLFIKSTDGFSIEKHHAELPENIKGYVELIYSLAGSPDMRVFENLLYMNGLHGPDTQSVLLYRIKTTSGHSR